MTTGTAAFDAFGREMSAAVDRLRAIDSDGLIEHIVELLHDAGVSGEIVIGDALADVARQGSIEAMAALIVIGDGKTGAESVAHNAMAAMVLAEMIDRSADLQDGIITAGLMDIIEEIYEDDVRAGRTIREVDPKTGAVYYRRRSQ